MDREIEKLNEILKRKSDEIVALNRKLEDERKMGGGRGAERRREDERREEEGFGLGEKSYYEERIRVLVGDNEKMAGILRMKVSAEIGLVAKVEEMGRENQMMKMEIDRMKMGIGNYNK